MNLSDSKKNGERYWGRIHVARIDEHENIGIVEVITEQKAPEEKLQEFTLLLK